MRTFILLLTVLAFFIQVKSQNEEIEIYLMQNNSIVKGKLLKSSDDSVRIIVDRLNTMAFAKSQLEGKDLPVSKEVKKLRLKLMRNESKKPMSLFPGIYQIRTGDTKGKIMFIFSSIGVIGAISSAVVFVVVLTTIPGLYGVLVAVAKSLITFAASATFWSVGNIWSLGDISKKIEKKVKNRYYYRAAIPLLSPSIGAETNFKSGL